MDRLELERAAGLSSPSADPGKRNTSSSARPTWSTIRPKVPAERAKLPGTRQPGYAGGKTYTPHKSASRWIAALLTCKRRSRCNLIRYPGASKLLEELYDNAIAHGGDLRDDRAAESIAVDVGWSDPESVRRHSLTVMTMGEAFVAAGAGCSTRSDGRAWRGLPTNLRILTRPLAFLHLAPARLRAELLADAGVRAAVAWLRAVAAAASAVVPARGAEVASPAAETPTFVGGSMSLEALPAQIALGSSPFLPPLGAPPPASEPARADAGRETRAGPFDGGPAGPETQGAASGGATVAGDDRPELPDAAAPAPHAPRRDSEAAPPAPATPIVAIDERGFVGPTVAEEWRRRRTAIAREVLQALAPLLAQTPPVPPPARDPRHAAEAAAVAAAVAAAEDRDAAEAELERTRLDLRRLRITRARELAGSVERRRDESVARDRADFRRSPRRWLELLDQVEREELQRDLEQLEPRLLEVPWPAVGYDAGGVFVEVPGAAAVVQRAVALAVSRKYGGTDHE